MSRATASYDQAEDFAKAVDMMYEMEADRLYDHQGPRFSRENPLIRNIEHYVGGRDEAIDIVDEVKEKGPRAASESLAAQMEGYSDAFKRGKQSFRFSDNLIPKDRLQYAHEQLERINSSEMREQTLMDASEDEIKVIGSRATAVFEILSKNLFESIKNHYDENTARRYDLAVDNSNFEKAEQILERE